MHRINLTNIISMDALWIFEWNRNCLPFWRNWVLPRFLWGSCVVFSRSLFSLFHLAIVLFCPSIYGFWLPILYVPRNIWIYTPLYNWVHVALSLAFCVMLCRLLFVILSFLPMYCLSFIDYIFGIIHIFLDITSYYYIWF
jgi:hypothetical protein